MRWFKHISTSQHDETLSELMDKFGAEGYGVWWIVLEKIAQLMDESGRCFARFSLKVWATSAKVSVKRFQNIVEFLEKKSSFILNYEDNYLTIECTNLLKYRDEWTERKAKSRDKLPSNSRDNAGVTPGLLKHDPDTESDTDNKEILPNGSTKKKTKLPDNFCVTDAHRELAKKNGWPPPDDEFEAFCDHHIAKGNKFADWDRAFYTWLRNCKTRFPKNPSATKINLELQAQIKNLYHEMLPACCPVNYWPSEAAANLQARIDENPKYQTVAGWKEFFAYVAESKKLTGKVNMRDGTKFKLSLSYLVKEKSFSDVCNSVWHEPDEEAAFANKQTGAA